MDGWHKNLDERNLVEKRIDVRRMRRWFVRWRKREEKQS